MSGEVGGSQKFPGLFFWGLENFCEFCDQQPFCLLINKLQAEHAPSKLWEKPQPTHVCAAKS